MKALLKRVFLISVLMLSMVTATGAAKPFALTLSVDASALISSSFALPSVGTFDPEDPRYGAQLEDGLALSVYNTYVTQLTPETTQLTHDIETIDLSEYNIKTDADFTAFVQERQYYEKLFAALSAFMYDHPEMAYCTPRSEFSFSLWSDDGKVATISAIQTIVQDQDSKSLKESMGSLLADFRASFDFSLPIMEQYRYVHDYVCKLTDYNYDALVTDNPDAHTAYGALVKGIDVVCEGYSKSFKVLCDVVDLPCLLISGEGAADYNGDGRLELIGETNHMWNAVEVDGAWYAIDATWNDSVIPCYSNPDDTEQLMDLVMITYQYFMNNTSFLEGSGQDHVASNHIYFDTYCPMLFDLPVLTAGRYSGTESLTPDHLVVSYYGTNLVIPSTFMDKPIYSILPSDIPNVTIQLNGDQVLSSAFRVPAGKTYSLHSDTSARSTGCSITRAEGFDGPLFSVSGDLVIDNVNVPVDAGILAQLDGGTFSAPQYESQLVCKFDLPSSYGNIVQWKAFYNQEGRMTDLEPLDPTEPCDYTSLFPTQSRASSLDRTFIYSERTLAPFIPTAIDISFKQ